MIAFTALPAAFENDIYCIYVMDDDGSNLRRLTDERMGDCSRLAWSPDRTQLVFTRAEMEGEQQKSEQLCIIDIASGEINTLTPGISVARPEVWLPSGQLIVNIVNTEMNTFLLVWPDGTIEREMPVLSNYKQFDWSLDGCHLVMIENRGIGRICLADTYGDGVRRVVGEEGNPAYNWPCLSPDNRRIAFARYEDLYVMNVDGSDLQRLDVMSGLLPPNGNTDFVWSPDSRSIVYTGHDEWDGNPASPDVEAALCVIGADGTGWRCLVVYPGYEDNVNKLTPAWAPDGQWVYFVMCDDEENYEHIYRIRPDGSDMQCLVGEAYELFTIDELNLPLLPQRA